VFDYLFASLSMSWNLFSWYYKSKLFIFVLLILICFLVQCFLRVSIFVIAYCFYSIFRRDCFCLHIILFILLWFVDLLINFAKQYSNINNLYQRKPFWSRINVYTKKMYTTKKALQHPFDLIYIEKYSKTWFSDHLY